MRRDLAIRLLNGEVAVCRADPAFQLDGIRIWRKGTDIFVAFSAGTGGKPGTFRLACAEFDARPPSVAMVDSKSHAELPLEDWTPGVPHSIHPVTQRPFVCLQGIAEYHSHPSHVSDSWDRYRARFRIRETAKKLLKKAGAL
jgi:hypothetical protein